MPKLSEERKAEIEAAIKRKVLKAIFKIIKQPLSCSKNAALFSMELIARKAGISKGALYNHFKNKADLISYIVLHSLEPYEKEEAEIVFSNMKACEKLQAFVRLNLNIRNEVGKMLFILCNSRTSAPDAERICAKLNRIGRQRLAKALEQGIREGMFKDISINDLMWTFTAIISSFAEGRLHYGTKYPIGEKAEIIMDMFINGTGNAGIDVSSLEGLQCY